MKITYEVRDIVQLQDDVNVPDDLGACTVELIKKLSNGQWEVALVAGDSEFIDEDQYVTINEIWFIP